MKLAVFGASGRMGQAVVRIAQEDPTIQIVGAVAAANDPALGRDVGDVAGVGAIGVEISSDLNAGLMGADVVIDFSIASAVPALYAACEKKGVALVSCTTNLDDKAQGLLDKAAEKVAVVWSANMSLGVQILAELVESAVRRLGLDFDVEIVEVHHRRKVDSPSGTAVRLAQAAQAVRKDLVEVRGRDGQIGARKPEELGIFGVRGGDVIGDHTVHLIGDSERIELTHRAINRDLFARGALKAAHFVAKQPAGRYTIKDVLGD